MNRKDLGQVSKPSRYIGNEINAILKDHRLVALKVALAFPDTYEIGMSHMGLKILYEILNNREDTAAERVYAPWKDMEEILRSQGKPLLTLESNLPLREFDMIGFTLQYEMSYTNILNMLDLSGIPLFSRQRDRSFPLIIAGGPCAFNPEPLADFFDLFIIGDGEEVIEEFVEKFKEYRSEEKEILLDRLAEIEGVYVPSHFQVDYASDGRIQKVHRSNAGPERIRKRLVADLNRVPAPCSPVLPYMKVVHDRVALEISRGCTRGCRFCQAGMIYRPVRERETVRLMDNLKESILATGHDEVSLTSLSSGDYTALSQLVREVVRYAQERHVSVSLPSLRPGTLTHEIIHEIQKIRKTGFTIAPEAGTQRLRDVINKGIDQEDILKTVDQVFSQGWEVLKLYFMIGLPTETQDDLQGIVDLSHEALKIAKQANPRFKQINVSVSPFVPKPHTPFQWTGQSRLEEIQEKFEFLKRHLKHRKIKLKWHEPEISMMEGLFSRGDRRLSKLLHEAYRSGCRFDGWTEEFDHAKWMEAIQKTGTDPEFYLHRKRELDEILPWDHIDSGIDKAFLVQEYENALKEETTPDCREDICSQCGACTDETGLVFAHPQEKGEQRLSPSRKEVQTVKRFRIRFTKEDPLHLLSHLELVSLMVRAFARAGIPLEYSQGFHPHPKIAMGPALPVGVSGTAEYLDVNVLGSLFEEALCQRLNHVLPSGVRMTGANWIPTKAPAISSIIRFGEYLLRIPRNLFREEPGRKVTSLMAQQEILVRRKRKGREKELNIRPMIQEMDLLEIEEKTVTLRFMVQTGDQGGVRPNEVVQILLDQPEGETPVYEISRIGLYQNEKRETPFQEKKMATVLQA